LFRRMDLGKNGEFALRLWQVSTPVSASAP
jgi:hypothetical protein